MWGACLFTPRRWCWRSGSEIDATRNVTELAVNLAALLALVLTNKSRVARDFIGLVVDDSLTKVRGK